MNTNSQNSNEKLHYETLLKLFKNLIWVITILVTIAAALIGTSISSLKSDMKSELTSLKNQINDLENKAKNSIKETRLEADKQLELIRSNANTVVDFTKEITETQVKVIREDVKNLALSTARTRVEEAFQNENISSLVENKAEKVIGSRLENLVNNELKNVKLVFEYIPQMTTAYDQIRQGNRVYFDILDTLAHFNEHPIVNEIAKELLLQKGADYEQSLLRLIDINEKKKSTYNELYTSMKFNDKFINNSTPILRVRRLIDTIQHSNILYNVTAAFLLINEELKLEIQPFDMQISRDLAKKYKTEK